jgi:hypothetical protein
LWDLLLPELLTLSLIVGLVQSLMVEFESTPWKFELALLMFVLALSLLVPLTFLLALPFLLSLPLVPPFKLVLPLVWLISARLELVLLQSDVPLLLHVVLQLPLGLPLKLVLEQPL